MEGLLDPLKNSGAFTITTDARILGINTYTDRLKSKKLYEKPKHFTLEMRYTKQQSQKKVYGL